MFRIIRKTALEFQQTICKVSVGGLSKQSVTTVFTHQAFHPDPTYEEIKDNPALSAAAHPGPSTVYATAQLPTVLSDDPTYSTAELPTVLSDDPTYSTAELPTNPCADSTVSFSKGPTAASVTFRQENCANSTVSSDQ